MKPDLKTEMVWVQNLRLVIDQNAVFGEDWKRIFNTRLTELLGEREACAAIAEGYRENMSFWMSKEWKVAKEASEIASKSIAEAIRNRP